MDKEELAPHVKDIVQALGNIIDEEEAAEELDNYVNNYQVPLETAKRSIVKKFGGDSRQLRINV